MKQRAKNSLFLDIKNNMIAIIINAPLKTLLLTTIRLAIF